MNINTNCQDCVFASYGRDGFQHGCQLGRSEKLGVSEESEGKKNFILNRFCNTYRPDDWLKVLSFDESMDIESTVLDEIMPRLGFFVRLDTDEPNAIDALDYTLNSINRSTVHPAYVVVVTDKVEYNEEVWGLFIKHFGEQNFITKYHVLQLTEEPETIMKIVDAAFTHAENGWIMTTTSGCTVKPDIVEKLHKILNKDMKQIILVEPYDDYNGMIFPAYLFKFLNGNENKIFRDEILDGRAFIDKVRAAEERGKTKHIMKSEEFNAS
jgi:hypothetical protein